MCHSLCGRGAPWQYEAGTHMVYWLPAEGFNVDYYTDQDVNREGAKLLAPYKVVLTGSHPEYISETISTRSRPTPTVGAGSCTWAVTASTG
jgi:hypothetical protein